MRFVCLLSALAFPFLFPEHAPVMWFGLALGGFLFGTVDKQLDALTSRVDQLRELVAPHTQPAKPASYWEPMSWAEWRETAVFVGGPLVLVLIWLLR